MANVLDWLKYRIISFYDEANKLKHGMMCRPRFALFYPTYVCNHNCIGCDYAELNNERPVMWSREQYLKVIHSCNVLGVRAFELCGGGEATLHPNTREMLDIAHTKYNMSFGVLTNGSMLHKIQDVLVDYGSYCRVSLESACEETFNVYKRPKSADASFPRVINNVRNLVIARNEASSKLQVGYKFSLDKNNWRDISKAFPLAMELGVDSLQFKRIRNVPSELNAIETVRAMKIIMEGVRQYPNLRVLGVDLQPTVLECGCWLTPIHLLVDPEGYVALCCYYKQRPDWRETHCLGNMFKESLRELWYSQKHWDVLKKIDSRECNKYDCRFHYYNKLMRDLVVDGVGQLDFI